MLNLDPEILQDFMTESGELLEQLESDLVELERGPGDLELINRVFRALHTIKGSASFLSLTNLVKIAHAAEGALNTARNRVITVDRAMMDLLLQAVDLLKLQSTQLAAGQDLTAPAAPLIHGLTLLAEGKRPGHAQPAPAAPTPPAQARPAPASEVGTPLELTGNRADLLEFFVSDLDQTIEQLTLHAPGLAAAETRSAAAEKLAELGDALIKTVDFFGFTAVTALARAIAEAGDQAAGLDDQAAGQLSPRIAAMITLLREQADALRHRRLLEHPIRTLLDRVESILAGRDLEPEAVLPAGAGPGEALVADGVRSAAAQAAPTEGATETTPEPIAEAMPEGDAGPDAPGPGRDGPARKGPAAAEHTIRVEVGRLETLMNLVGELVLQKNRISALTRGLAREIAGGGETREAMQMAAGGLDRITGEIQVAVMRTRMQPLDKLFGKYPRLIRDLSRKTSKKIDLVIEGGDTEVDKSMIEELADPLIHLLRNSADHGVEPPAERLAAGKPESGTIRLAASHKGSHVEVRVIDDGRGLVRERIIRKAVERSLVTAEHAAALPDREVFAFIFLPGFSTAEQVSDLSGRGVGMDVVRTNIEKLKGTITLDSRPGQGTTITITIPLTVAILPAMMVGVGNEVYAVPLSNVLEIVKPRAEQISSIGRRPVMRLRDTVLPLVRADELFNLDTGQPLEDLFAVILTMNDRRVGLLVSRLIGQQEIVVKALEGVGLQGGAASGATVRDDGGVSLIIDVAELIRRAEGAPGTSTETPALARTD
ncbi:MAG: chemotaxis protein CheA [Phycisphaerales bacterium]|nr:chemotaxis protein CheA [Phycisphaerales bacterium]